MVSNTAVFGQPNQIYSKLRGCWKTNPNRFPQILSEHDKLHVRHFKYRSRVAKQEEGRVLLGGNPEHLTESTTTSMNCRLPADCITRFSQRLLHVLLPSCHSEGKQFFSCCVLNNALLFCLAHNLSISKNVCAVKCFRRSHGAEPSAWHADMRLWLDYNDWQGNNSQWTSCIGDFKPRTICTCQTLTLN